jgi:hypothetical protein
MINLIKDHIAEIDIPEYVKNLNDEWSKPDIPRIGDPPPGTRPK